MKRVILFLVCCVFLSAPLQAATASASVFGAGVDQDHPGKDYAPMGIGFGYSLGDAVQVGVDGFFFGDSGGLALTGGAKVGAFTLTLGAGNYSDEIKDTVNVAGTDVEGTGTDNGALVFIDVSYKKLFIRASQLDSDFNVIGKLQTGATPGGDPIYTYNSKPVSTRDRWLWIGYRASF